MGCVLEGLLDGSLEPEDVVDRGLRCAPPVPIGTSWNWLDSDWKFGSREPAKLVGDFSNFSDWIPLSSSDSDRFHQKV